MGVRTEGVQEALLKVNDASDTNRIAKMKQVIKAVSLWTMKTQINYVVKAHFLGNVIAIVFNFYFSNSFLSGGLILPANPWPQCM